MTQTAGRRGRPRLYDDPRQLSLYVEESEVESLLAAKPPHESRAAYLLRLVKAGLAALGMATAAEAPALPPPPAPLVAPAPTPPPCPAPVVPAAPTTDLWQAVLPRMRRVVGEESYEGFLLQARQTRLTAEVLTVGSHNAYVVDQLTERFAELAEEQLAELGQPRRVVFVQVAAPVTPPSVPPDPPPSPQAQLLAGIPEALLARDTVLLDVEARWQELARLHPSAIGVANEQAKLVTARWDRVKRIKEQLADGSHPFLKGRKLWGPDPFRRRR